MQDLELEFYFERSKRRIFEKIKKTQEKWEAAWQKAQGNHVAETELIHLKLEMQIREAEAIKELKIMEEKVKRASEDDWR